MTVNEVKLPDYPQPIFYEATEIILEQMKKSICKLKIDGVKGTGFFTQIKIDDKLIPVFVTNHHVINKKYLEVNDKIPLNIHDIPNEQRAISIKNKVIYLNEEHDVTMIEIKENIDGIYDYLELDDNILNENTLNDYIGNTIYLLHYPCYHEQQKLAVSYGIIKNRFLDKENNYSFKHFCCTESGSSGSPILNLSNNKVLGIHKQGKKNKEFNLGSFLFYDIKGFIDKYKGNNKNGEGENSIELKKKMNIDLKGINDNKLYLKNKKIGNYELEDLCEKIKFKELKELNLENNNISDIRALGNVKFEKLEILNLGGNQISNIDVLEKINFKELKQLHLFSNKISDIKVLEKVQFGKLEILDIGSNEISNIDILEKDNFKELKELHLYRNKISDITVLAKAKLEQLEILDLNGNNITNVDSLTKVNFKELKKLDLRFNDISDRKALETLKSKYKNIDIVV